MHCHVVMVTRSHDRDKRTYHSQEHCSTSLSPPPHCTATRQLDLLPPCHQYHTRPNWPKRRRLHGRFRFRLCICLSFVDVHSESWWLLLFVELVFGAVTVRLHDGRVLWRWFETSGNQQYSCWNGWTGHICLGLRQVVRILAKWTDSNRSHNQNSFLIEGSTMLVRMPVWAVLEFYVLQVPDVQAECWRRQIRELCQELNF